MPARLHGTDERGGGLDCLPKVLLYRIIEGFQPQAPSQKNMDHCAISAVQAA